LDIAIDTSRVTRASLAKVMGLAPMTSEKMGEQLACALCWIEYLKQPRRQRPTPEELQAHVGRRCH
jgi:hypothetical protein